MKKRLNNYWRVIATGISLSLFGIGTLLLSAVFALFVRFLPVSKSTKHGWLRASIQRMSAVFVNILQSLGLIFFSTHGPPLSSIRGHLIIANHPSLLDALFIIAATQNLCCIVKADLLKNPFTRYIVKLAGYIPNQSETLLADSARVLASGTNLLIFPEGTRNTSDEQLNFKRGAANIALSTGCPVSPVVFDYQPRMGQKHDKWYAVPESIPRVVMSSYSPLVSLDFVNVASPVTMQARQLNSGLIDFFRQEISGQPDRLPRQADVSPVVHQIRVR